MMMRMSRRIWVLVLVLCPLIVHSGHIHLQPPPHLGYWIDLIHGILTLIRYSELTIQPLLVTKGVMI